MQLLVYPKGGSLHFLDPSSDLPKNLELINNALGCFPQKNYKFPTVVRNYHIVPFETVSRNA